ncbi:MDR family oxidoreductase [Frigoribacterium sp. Leaf186]|uniref:MDR family oxidoreductase n=1 Tax=Frigoribacterium sp. Leaf186 TaxID=1736293 RepID=UPI0006F90288|nr:MDR family oxidoreductase [Frigoribacterium sp. Leaf186]KQS17469.1 NADPH:quinone dehydrogenase [Frigoribacterium sp. Leaf186]
MRAVVVEQGRGPALLDRPEPEPHDGEVLVEVLWSGVNYKDGLALRGDPGVAKIDPLVPGIDVVGRVVAASGEVAQGDLVVVNGAGLGETRDGGYADRVVVAAESLVVLPENVSPRRAAAVGTAGFTAMLSVLRLERDVAPGDGEIVVTGAAGGVGSVAVMLLSRLGYSVTASSGRLETESDYLRSLGATSVIDRAELASEGRPLQRARWAGAIDGVGSSTLATLLAQTSWGGVVTACGLAQGSDLPTTVLPFILRGVTLAGVNSVDAPPALRRTAWRRLATDLDLDLLDTATTEVDLADVVDAGRRVLAGETRGRTVVRVGA